MSNFSEVKVYPQNGGSSLLARGSFVLAGAVKINFAYINGKNGPFVSLPQDKVEKDGQTNYYPHAKFITKEAVAEINQLVKSEYDKVRNGTTSDAVNTNNSSPNDDLPF